MNPVSPQLNPHDASMPASTMSPALRILATTLRALFVGALIVIIARVSSPQSETIWTVYETPEDMFRLGLGLAACVWLVVHIFMFSKDAEGI